MGRDLSRARAILIGNGRFDHSQVGGLPALKCVAAMADLLAGDLCGWPAERIIRIEDVPRPDALARRVHEAIMDVQDVLLVYYVGHGFRTRDGKLALALNGTDPGTDLLPSTAMLYETFADILRGCPAVTKLVILDCCHAELGNKANYIFQGADADLAQAYPVTGLYFIGASKWNGNAKAPDSGALTYFTQALVDVVRGGIPGQPGELQLDQIFLELRDRLVKAGLPEPVESGSRGAHRYPFARNAAQSPITAVPSAGSSTAQLGRDVREEYRQVMREAGIKAAREPGWSQQDLESLCDALGPGASRLRDTVAALHDATEAKPVFTAVEGPGIQLSRLRYFYYLSVGRWPGSGSSDAMLVEAAAAAIAERKKVQPDLTALARFILTVAQECRGPVEHPLLSEWLTSAGHSPADARAYMRNGNQRPAWLLIRFTGAWPTEVSALVLAGDQEAGFTRACHPSREGLSEVLREILAEVLPPLAVVDLEMPRELLHLGIERWPLIRSYGSDESLSDRHQPRLRWSGRNRVVEARWRQRTSMADWAGRPIELQTVEDDPGSEVVRRQLQAHPRAPYLIGRQPRGDGSSDPLLVTLVEGCGFIVWFPSDADGEIFPQVVRKAKRVQRQARRQLLPDMFLGTGTPPPAVIWDDPDGRAGYRLPRAAAQGP